jgi:hypothetical protein
MKIIREDIYTLELYNQSHLGTKIFILIWSSLFMGIPLILIIGFLSGIGTFELSCQKTGQNLIRCQRDETKYFGLVSTPTQVIDQITEARVQSTEGTDSDGDRTIDHAVNLVTKAGEVKAVEGFMRMNGTKGSLDEMQEIANTVNTFIRANSSSPLKIQRHKPDSFWPILLMLGFPLLFELIGGAVIFGVFQSERLIFDRFSGQFIRDRKTLLGRREQTFSLREITGMHVITKTDSDGDKTYELHLIPESIHRNKLMSSINRRDVEAIQNTIRTFLNLPQP